MAKNHRTTAPTSTQEVPVTITRVALYARVIRSTAVFINGKPLVEPYATVGATKDAPMCEWVVPRNSIFVLGDNRDESEDSRSLGPVPVHAVIGEPLFVCWSFSNTWQEWIGENGKVRAAAYLSVARSPIARTRWSRFGRRLSY